MKKYTSIKKAAAAFTLAVLLLAGCGTARDGGFLEQGDKAPDFTLSSADGSRVTLSDALSNSDGVVLWFTNLCPGCEENVPAVQRIYLEYGGKVEVFAISQLGADVDPVREFI